MTDAVALPDLAANEAVIEQGLRTFVEVGTALADIRDRHLYEQPTFEAYVRERWGWTRGHAYNLMAAAEVERITGNTLPTIQHGAMLAPLPVERQRELAPAIVDMTVREAREYVRAAEAPIKPYIKEEAPVDIIPWTSLVAVLDEIEGLSSTDASVIAATIPPRRRAATAKRLRKLGTYLGRIAWLIETKEIKDDARNTG